jgi:hypothetical protein
MYYDMGIDRDTDKFILRISNDIEKAFVVEFDNFQNLFDFQEKLGMAVGMYKNYLEEKISSLGTDQEIGNRK